MGYDGVRVAVTRIVGEGVGKFSKSGVDVAFANEVALASLSGVASSSPIMAKLPSAKTLSSSRAKRVNCNTSPGFISTPVQ